MKVMDIYKLQIEVIPSHGDTGYIFPHVVVDRATLYKTHDIMIGDSIGDQFPTVASAIYQRDDFWDDEKAARVVAAAAAYDLENSGTFRFEEACGAMHAIAMETVHRVTVKKGWADG
jgi:hypothetical protein